MRGETVLERPNEARIWRELEEVVRRLVGHFRALMRPQDGPLRSVGNGLGRPVPRSAPPGDVAGDGQIA